MHINVAIIEAPARHNRMTNVLTMGAIPRSVADRLNTQPQPGTERLAVPAAKLPLC